MKASHLILLVEEPSVEAALAQLLPMLLPSTTTFEVHSFGSKDQLKKKLRDRLRGYANWLPADQRIVVLVDRDDDDCVELKELLLKDVDAAGLRPRSSGHAWQVAIRVVVEELEAWFFGDWEAVREAYPGVPTTIPMQAKYRDPDAIAGGTWEALERILQGAGYFAGGLAKIELARTVSSRMRFERNSSPSFRAFSTLLRDL